MNATLHIIGVGPGDPDLLTRKALRTLEECPVIATPKGSEHGVSTALSIVEQALTLDGKEIIELYYNALYSGDLPFVKELMTAESYNMTLETFGLRLSLRDVDFKAKLKEIDENSVSLAEVERKLSDELVSRNKSPKIIVVSVLWNGTHRQSIEYTEDGNLKKLHFSKEAEDWKINYFAGRKVA